MRGGPRSSVGPHRAKRDLSVAETEIENRPRGFMNKHDELAIAAQLLRGRWDPFTLPAASIVMVLSGPGNVPVASTRDIASV